MGKALRIECNPYTDVRRRSPSRRFTVAAVLALAVAAIGPTASVHSAAMLVGGLTEIAGIVPGPNRLANAGFEATTAAPWSGSPGWNVDRHTAHTGRGSYRRDASGASATTTLALPAGSYRFSAWVKTENLAGGARLRFDVRPQTPRWFTTEIAPGTADWRHYELSDLVLTEPATVTLVLETDGGTGGTAWFDDLRLEEQLPSLVDAFLLYPNFRGTLFDDGPSTLTFDLRVAPPARDFARHTVRGVLREEATGRVVGTASYPARAEFVAELDGGGMRPGTPYLATFVLTDDASGRELYTTPAYRVWRAPVEARAAMTLSVDRDNRVEIRGVPRFVLGSDDHRVAQHPVDLRIQPIDAPLSTPSSALERYAAFRRSDPDALTMAITAPTTDRPRWRDVADVVATDAYAMFGPEPAAGYDHAAIARATALSRAAVRDARPVIGVLPFAQLSSLGRWPTRAEMRAHAYMAIVEGARGLWWSTAAEDLCPGDCADKTQHLKDLQRVIEELAALEPVLLAADAPDALAHNSNSNIKAKVKLVNGKGFVLAYNASGSRQSATFTWRTTPETVTVHAEHRTLATSGRSFSDTFVPFAAHVYVVDGGRGEAR